MTTLLTLWLVLLVMPTKTGRELHRYWNKPQSQFYVIRATAGGPLEEVDFEGAVRAGKSTPAADKLADYTVEYPGIHMAATRWTQDGLDAQVKPLWRDTAMLHGLTLRWHADEEYDEIVGTGSRVYLRALKASEGTNRYGKLAGLTLAALWIDQPEEAPEDVINAYVPARLSQPGYPHEAWFTPNPPREDHWLARRFPEANTTPHRTYIRTSVYDNRHNLGDEYIAGLERAYPVGTVLRRRFIEGKRGLNATGRPVYANYFRRDTHAGPIPLNRELPLIELWDFGQHRPCCVWQQFTPWGAMHVLGGVMGEDIYIEDFAPLVLAQRAQWFPHASELWSACDPAGSKANSQGTKKTALDVLADVLGYRPRFTENSNAPEVRAFAIQTTAGYMRRRAIRGGEAFRVDADRWLIVSQTESVKRQFYLDGLEAGYVWDDRVVRGAGGKVIQVPLKDKYYEHAQNCVEYGVINFGPAYMTQADERKIERQVLKRAQEDRDPDDLAARAAAARTGRRGSRSVGRRLGRRGGY